MRATFSGWRLFVRSVSVVSAPIAGGRQGAWPTRDVEEGTVRVDKRVCLGHAMVPEEHEGVRRDNPLEDLRRCTGRPGDAAADDERPVAPVRIGDAEDGQPCTA